MCTMHPHKKFKTRKCPKSRLKNNKTKKNNPLQEQPLLQAAYKNTDPHAT